MAIRDQLSNPFQAAIDSQIWSAKNSIREGEMSHAERWLISAALPFADVKCLHLYGIDRIEAETVGLREVDDEGFSRDRFPIRLP